MKNLLHTTEVVIIKPIASNNVPGVKPQPVVTIKPQPVVAIKPPLDR